MPIHPMRAAVARYGQTRPKRQRCNSSTGCGSCLWTGGEAGVDEVTAGTRRGPATPSFAHLHAHTEFSMLDGAARIADLVAAAVDDGQPALAITDHGNMYGVLDFYKQCRAQGITPIIGTEAYMAANSRFERPVRRGPRRRHRR